MDERLLIAFFTLTGACIGYGLRSVSAFIQETRSHKILKDAMMHIKSASAGEYVQAKAYEKAIEQAPVNLPAQHATEKATRNDSLSELRGIIGEYEKSTGDSVEVM